MAQAIITNQSARVEHVAVPGDVLKPLCGAENTSGTPWTVVGKKEWKDKKLCSRCSTTIGQINDLVGKVNLAQAT